MPVTRELWRFEIIGYRTPIDEKKIYVDKEQRKIDFIAEDCKRQPNSGRNAAEKISQTE